MEPSSFRSSSQSGSFNKGAPGPREEHLTGIFQPQAPEEADWIQWEPEVTQQHEISEDGLSITLVLDMLQTTSFGGCPWAACGILPTEGKSTWTIRVDNSAENSGCLSIGICDAQAMHAWGLSLSSGKLLRYTRDSSGHQLLDKPPPPGWPDGDGNDILPRDDEGGSRGLESKANGTLIDVIVDHEAGRLMYRFNGGRPFLALTDLPQSAEVRPWARLFYGFGDQVSIVRRASFEAREVQRGQSSASSKHPDLQAFGAP